MASAHRPRSLNEVLGKLIDDLGIERKLEEARVIDAWRAVAGGPIDAVTERVWISGGTLHVKLSSATWRQELYLHRRDWCKRLNAQLGSDLVEDIHFR